MNLLLLLLSCFSRVRLCATPETAAHQAPLSLGFSRQEHWSGLPFPSPMHERKRESEVAQLCPTPSNTRDCSPPSSSIHGIFQARVLEWGAIAFSDQMNLGLIKWTEYNRRETIQVIRCSHRAFDFLKDFPGDLVVKNPPPMQETQDKEVWSLGWEDPLEEEIATHSSSLAWKIPWTEELGRLQFAGSQKSWTQLTDWTKGLFSNNM